MNRILADGEDLVKGRFHVRPCLDVIDVYAGFLAHIDVVDYALDGHVKRKHEHVAVLIGDNGRDLRVYVLDEVQLVDRHEVIAVACDGPAVRVKHVGHVVRRHLGFHKLFIGLAGGRELDRVARLLLKGLDCGLHGLDLRAGAADPHRDGDVFRGRFGLRRGVRRRSLCRRLRRLSAGGH